MGVGIGDLFLFFGWFREVDETDGQLQYSRSAPHLHVIFGWLQIGKMLMPGLNDGAVPEWLAEHPHVCHADTWRESHQNTVYVSSKQLVLPRLKRVIPGAGIFKTFDKRLQLTAPGMGRSTWRLPACFHPTAGQLPLSFHSDESRWRKNGEDVLLKTVARGQEFVLDLDCYPSAAMKWVRALFSGM